MPEQIIVNEILTSYHLSGPGQTPAVIFLHGWGSSKEVWVPTMQFLKTVGISSLALDLPGFGKTELPPQVWSVEDYTTFVSDFLKKINVASAIIIGHSFGGRLGIVLAATEPVLISKLILVDSAGVYTSKGFKKFLAAIAKIVKPFFRLRFIQPLRKQIYRRIGAEDYVATPELNATFVKVIGEDLRNFLPSIQQPTLIIWGRNDLVTPLFFAEQFLSQIENSKLVVLENAGHYSFLDQPQKFFAALENFIL